MKSRSIVRACFKSAGSCDVSARRSRWCAPSGMKTAGKSLVTLFNTPPADHGSKPPLLWRDHTKAIYNTINYNHIPPK